MNRTKPLKGELLKLKDEIHEIAVSYGLDFYPVIFEVCDYDTVCILAAGGGFPSRYPHWRFGMDYDGLAKGNTYGFQRIYELVINTDPCYAYLLSSNRLVDQKLVMAHVYGHADFFKHNAWFKNTDRKMMDVMANHATKVRRYMERFGQDRVEAFIDKVISLENLMDTNVLFETPEVIRGRQKNIELAHCENENEEDDDRSQALKSFMRTKKRYEERDSQSDLRRKKKDREDVIPTSEATKFKGSRDIMLFLLEYAPLAEWEADIIGILREEAYYFLPQRMTKIMNEGWASYWHSKIMTQHVARSSEIVDFADVHAGVMAMSRQSINPYKIGIELMRDIEFRWDTGRFGKEYQDCVDMRERANWNTHLGKGREKIFEVRASHNDITFIDEFMTQEFCERQQLFTYKYNQRTGRFEIDSRDFHAIKQKLLADLTNFGQPVIEIENSNYDNRGELLLRHVHQGVDLDMSYAADTMKNIFFLWKRPVNIATIQESKEMVFCFDGKEFKPTTKN